MDPHLFLASSLLFTILILAHLPALSAQDSGQYSTCSQLLTCGNIGEISYPFWGGTRPNYCGHPSFNLNCSGAAPLLTIQTRPYRVLLIDNTNYTLKVVREEFWNNDCPQYLYNATLDTAHFTYTSDTSDLMLYYGCTAPISNGIPNQFSCAANATNSFAIYGSSSLTSNPFANWTSLTCGTSVSVTVNQMAGQALLSGASTNVTAVLDGFDGLAGQ